MKRVFFIFYLAQVTCISLHAQNFNEDKVLGLVEILSHDSLKGRKTGTEENKKAQKIIQKFYQEHHLEFLKNYTSYTHPFKIGNKTGTNILGYLPGSVFPEQYIVISAHYDHLGTRNGRVFNGADDNASGVGGLMAAMDYFTKNPPKNSILFAAFDGEEIDLLGSKNFVSHPPVPLKKILLNINLDMVSRSDKKELYAAGANYYPYLKTYLQKSDEENNGVDLKFGHDFPDKKHPSNDWTFASDHGPFHQQKIPFIYFGVEDHEDYHQSSDDFEKINKSFYLSSLKLIIDVIETLDNHSEAIKSRQSK